MLNEYSVVLPVVVLCVSLYLATRKQLSLPVVGRLTSPGLFGFWFPGVVANILSTREVLEKGYRKVCLWLWYSLNDKAFFIPQLEANNILIPPAWIKAYKRAPTSDLNLDGAIEDNLQIRYLLGPQIRQNSYHIEWTRDSLTPLMPSILDWLHEEIADCLDQVLGKDNHDLHKVKIFPFSLSLNCRIAARIVVGKPLCRDAKFQHLCEQHSQLLVVLSMILKFLPDWCKPLVVRMSPIRGVQRQITDLVRPLVLESYRKLKQGGQDSKGTTSEPPEGEQESLMDSLVRTAVSRTPSLTAEEDIVHEITMRFLSILFLFSGSPTLTVANMVLDLVSEPRELYFDALRSEITSVFEKYGGRWTLENLKELDLTDSFIKESMRLRPAAFTIAGRKVINPRGYTLPDNSATVPFGSYLTLPMYAIHHDQNHYPPRAGDGSDFDGFRFKATENNEAVPLVGSSETFLSWGAGRHICPGRFASAAILKMCLAELIRQCDFKPRNRIADITFANIYVPSKTLTVEMRRRNSQ
ncbi:cytochrome P450 [Trichoderma camerunense]